jgi:hypothetical protein
MSNTYDFIKFCNQNVMDIKDELLKSFILKKLDEFYYLKKKKIITEEELDLIKNNKYPIFIEYNSYRVTIFLTKYQNRNYCILIDQNIPNKVKMLIIKLRFHQDLYTNDTIFEAEIVLNKNKKWDILIYDLKFYKGEKINLNVLEKLNKINDILTHEYINDKYMNLGNLKVKKYYHFKDLGDIILKKIDQSNYLVTGLSFIDEENYYLINFQNKVFTENDNVKVKTKELKNKYFEIKDTVMPDIYDLYDINKTKVGIACISNLETSELCINILESKESGLVECKYNNKFKKWEPIKELESNITLSEL